MALSVMPLIFEPLSTTSTPTSILRPTPISPILISRERRAAGGGGRRTGVWIGRCRRRMGWSRCGGPLGHRGRGQEGYSVGELNEGADELAHGAVPREEASEAQNVGGILVQVKHPDSN